MVLGELIGGQHRQMVNRADIGEERLQTVVIALRDGIELVVVAPGAAERQAEEDRAGGVGDVVEHLLAALLQVDGVVLVGEAAVEAGGDQRLRVVGVQLVAGDLLLDEAVVRLVLVEGAG